MKLIEILSHARARRFALLGLCGLVATVYLVNANDDSLGAFDQVTGEVLRVSTSDGSQWESSDTGDSIFLGDLVRSLSDSSATIRFHRGGLLELGSDSLLRFFESHPNDGGQVQLLTGHAIVEAIDGDLEFGAITIDTGSQVRVQIGAQDVQVTVLRGSARPSDRSQARQPQDSRSFSIARTTWDRRNRVPANSAIASTTAPSAPPSNEAAPPMAEDESSPSARPATHIPNAALTIQAGSGVSIHSGANEVRTRIRFPERCGPRSYITSAPTGSQRFRNPEGRSATLALRRGTTPYILHCLEGSAPFPSGLITARLSLLPDVALRRSPTRAQRNHVQADGRRYQVVYQNVRPSLSLGWADAPAANRYTFVITSADGRTRRLQRARPQMTLSGRHLVSGSYHWYIDTPTGRSPTTWVRLTVEQDQPRFALVSPRPGRVGTGPVRFSGFATPGTQIRVGGQEIIADASGEFRGMATVPPSQRHVAVHVQHPTLGHRIYLRQRRGGV